MSTGFNDHAKYNKKRMGIKKIIKKVLKEPATIRINEVISLLGHFGYRLERTKGSHFIFRAHVKNRFCDKNNEILSEMLEE